MAIKNITHAFDNLAITTNSTTKGVRQRASSNYSYGFFIKPYAGMNLAQHCDSQQNPWSKLSKQQKVAGKTDGYIERSD